MDSARSVRRPWPTIAIAGLLSAAPGSMPVANANDAHEATATAEWSEEQAAAERYIADLRVLLATRIVPGIRRGILRVATSRPPALTVEVSDDSSPYNMGVKIDADGSLRVRLSLGYATMHDAALDAVGLSAALHRPRDLRRYLLYQLRVARENHWLRASSGAPQRAMTFAQFVGLDAKVAETVYAQRDWQASRDRVEVDSLGWTVAYLLVRADPKLSGTPPLPMPSDGAAAAHLAASSGWFPVPPFATAVHLAEVTRAPAVAWGLRAPLCRAALLMEGGIAGLHSDANWRNRLKQDAALQSRVAEIRLQIAAMRRDGGCLSADVTRL